jgi:glycine oxidase
MIVEHAVWGDLLTPAEREHLQPGLPEHLDRRPDVLVVGGGMVGLATAVACERSGLGSVVLIEREGRLGAGATGGAAGLLLPEAHAGVDPPWFVDLARRSLELWRQLEATWPGGVGLIGLDWLGLEGEAALDTQTGRRLDPHEVARLLPGLEHPRAGLLVTGQGRVNPLRAVATLAAGLRGVATGVEALGVDLEGDRIASLQTSAGEFSPGVVVFATANPPRLQGLDLGVPADFVKGHMLLTEPSPARLPGSVSPVATQLEDGRLLVGGSLDVGDHSPNVRPDVVLSMLRGLQAQLRDASGLGVAYQWCCFRPWHPDNLPVVDRVPGLRNAWFSSGHYRTGILMAPITAHLLSTWIASSDQPPETSSLSADRAPLRGRI